VESLACNCGAKLISPMAGPMFLNSSRLLTALGALALTSLATAGDIVGRVELMEKGGKKATDLSDVVVYVETAKAKPKPAKEAVAMKSKAFAPHVLAIGAGSTVDFPNEDPILHNVFSVSQEGFDLGLYKRPKSASRTFDKPGIYTVYCNIHPQMSATVLVVDNPYFAAVAKDGAFRIPGVPAGDYKLIAFHERAGEAALPVKVPATGDASVSFSLDASSYKRVAHKNKFGKDYGKEAY
jgi:plastocyanin